MTAGGHAAAVRKTRLRQQTGLSAVGLWERGKLRPAYPDTPIQPDSVLVVTGLPSQIATLNAQYDARHRGGDVFAARLPASPSRRSVELFSVPVPVSLVGSPLLDSRIGSRTGLSVVALQRGSHVIAPLASEMVLPADASLLMLGSQEQRAAFEAAFGKQ